MSFFDKKEDVIKLELTNYGRKLLSKGALNPKYYTFFDDDILYDSRYSSISESQNYSVERILKETPSFKPQSNFYSRDDNSLKLSEVAEYESNMSNVLPLGNSDHNSEYLPAWRINTVSGSTIDRVENKRNDINNRSSSSPKVPTIYFNTASYLIGVMKHEEAVKEELLEKVSENSVPNNKTLLDVFGGEEEISRQYLYGIQDEIIFHFNVEEKNVLNKKENFSVEIFVEEVTKDNNGNIASQEWKPLYFKPKPTNIQKINDNETILLDDMQGDLFDLEIKDNNVEWYFDVYFDDETLPLDEQLARASTVYGEAYSTNINDTDKPFGDDC